MMDPKPQKTVKVKKPMKRWKRPAKTDSATERSKQVHNTPCMICHKYGMEQLSRTAEHHWINGRFSGALTPDEEMLPLCEGHHQGLKDTSKIAIHKETDGWAASYGRDKDWLEYANKLIAKYNR